MITAIVLAAGKSARMGEKNKLLLPFRGSTIIGTVLKELVASQVNEIIVVIGNESIDLNLPKKSTPIKIINNHATNEGLTTSIHAGIKASNPKSKGFMFCLGDMPLLLKNDYNLLINNFIDKKEEVILVPIKGNKRGNPVIFSYHFLEQIMRLENKGGCKPLLLSFPSYVIEVPVTNNHYFIDIDTQENYNEAIK